MTSREQRRPGIPASNVAQYGIALQSAFGTPAAAPQYVFDVTAADLKPTPETEVREETGLGRDVGDTYIRLNAVTGGLTVLARPMTMGLFAYGVLGAKAVAGVGAPYTHTNTVANNQPAFTIWRTIGGILHEQFNDCKITGMTLSGEAGGDLQCALTIIGTEAEFVPTGMPAGGTYEQGTPFRVPGYSILVDTVANEAITQFSFAIEAAQVGIQTNRITYSYLESGQRTINGSYTEVTENIDPYRESLYGSTSGTALATELFEGEWQATFGDYTAGPGLRIDVPRTLMAPVQLDPDPGGDPLLTPVEFQAARPASGSIATISVVNSVATYPAAA